MNARILKNHERFKAVWAGRTRELAEIQCNKVAVVVHVFYPELWPEIGARLQRIRHPFDLFVTTSPELADAVTTAVIERFPAAHIHLFANKGMDVWPFLRLAPTWVANNYVAVCKLHTKRGEGAQGSTWRRAMLEPLVGDSAIFQQVAEAFAENSDLQMVGPAPLYQSAHHLMLKNAPLVNELQRKLVGKTLSGEDWGFFVGNMFWVRPSALQVLAPLAQPGGPLAEERFESSYERDGQLVHAVERVFGLLPRLQNGAIGLIHNAMTGGWTLQVAETEPTPSRAFIRELIPQCEALQRELRRAQDASL